MRNCYKFICIYLEYYFIRVNKLFWFRFDIYRMRQSSCIFLVLFNCFTTYYWSWNDLFVLYNDRFVLIPFSFTLILMTSIGFHYKSFRVPYLNRTYDGWCIPGIELKTKGTSTKRVVWLRLEAGWTTSSCSRWARLCRQRRQWRGHTVRNWQAKQGRHLLSIWNLQDVLLYVNWIGISTLSFCSWQY